MVEKNSRRESERRRWASSAPPLCQNRLMEKPGATTAHRPQPGTWAEKGGGGEGTQHTQYIRRLVDLRDELISQEETGLARALDRLRLHSINNREAARYRLKIKDPTSGTGESPRPGVPVTPGTSFPRPMLTTVEKFRQMRPQRRPPVIFPLQGKQLIDSSPVTTASTTRSSTEEGSRADTSSGTQRGVEDTVKANLQRLIQPTSSIPNIGRKALRQESLELKSQSLQNMRNRVFKTTRSHLMSPFMLSQDEEGSGGEGRAETEGEFHLSPHTYKLGPMTDGDRINMDKLNQYYYIYCMPDTPREDGEQGSLPHSTTPAQGQRRGGRMAGGQKPRRTNSDRSQVTRPFSDRSMVVSSETEGDGSSRYKHSMDAAGTDRMLLPVIHAYGESSGISPRKSNGHDAAFLTQRDGYDSPDTISTERRKRHIVIDMPHIIFNAATPDMGWDSGIPETRGVPEKPGLLSKTLKQNEIRHRELQNLLEDVKELNKRTETLSTHAQNSELDQSHTCVA